VSHVSPINLNLIHTPHPWVGVVDFLSKVILPFESSVPPQKKHISNSFPILKKLQNFLKQKDKRSIAKMIKYPLKRLHEVPSISNENEMINRFESVFDRKLINILLNAKTEDLAEMGSQGTMLKDGLLWFRDQKIIAINYYSKAEKKGKRENRYQSLSKIS
jgi:hypothetical protein